MSELLNTQDFLQAQAAVYPQALAEIQAGKKRSHWIWFVLPQLQGLGASPMAKRYGIADIPAAQAYLAEPLLRARLYEMIAAIAAHKQLSAQEILGAVDALKLRSCLTLFIAAQSGDAQAIAPLAALLKEKFDGEACALSLAKLAISPTAFSTLVFQHTVPLEADALSGADGQQSLPNRIMLPTGREFNYQGNVDEKNDHR